MKKLSLFLFCIAVISSFTFSQEQYGNIRGIVVDEEGEPLPSVTVTLESELYNPRTLLTSDGGIFRFLNVSVGPCRVKCELSGFKTYIQKNIEMTVDVMAHSLVYWTQDVIARNLMGRGGRVFSMTSSGSTRVIPSYGAVSAAKCALESHTRQLALELASFGVTVNALRGGVTRTPASEKIPGSDRLVVEAAKRNPYGRLTTPEDIAKAVVAMSVPGTDWITGNVINVDGGEEVTS